MPTFFSVLRTAVRCAATRRPRSPSRTTSCFTEREALRLFGTTDIVGRMLTFQRGEATVERRVTGVLRDLPAQTPFAVQRGDRASIPPSMPQNPEFLRNWGNATGWTYVRLRPGADVRADRGGAARFRDPPRAAVDRDRLAASAASRAGRANLPASIRRSPGCGRAATPARSALFTLIALLILGIATINFTNLATARARRRAREVGIRKALGARRRQLVAQFLGESVHDRAGRDADRPGRWSSSLLPSFAAFLDAPLQLTYFGADGILLPMLALTLFVGLLGGLYPALHLSRLPAASRC